MPVPDDLGPSHCLRKTFTVPELLTSATAAALATPGVRGEGWGARLHLPFSWLDSGQPPRSSVGRSASGLVFENRHFHILNLCSVFLSFIWIFWTLKNAALKIMYFCVCVLRAFMLLDLGGEIQDPPALRSLRFATSNAIFSNKYEDIYLY